KIQLENAKKEVEKEFPQEQELQEKQKRLNELNVELKLNEQDKELFSDDKDDNEVQKHKNSRDDRNR
nr:helicase [Clostridia bacterium]